MRRMRSIWLVLLAVALGSASTGAEDDTSLPASNASVRREVVEVIERQLAAFRSRDVGAAYRLAASGLRARYRQEGFARMVRERYPEMWANARAEYGLVRDDGTTAVLYVRIFTRDGRSAAYDYILFKDPGGWRVGGALRDRDGPEQRT